MKREIIEKTISNYKINFNNYNKLTNKTYKIMCKNGNCYILKKTELYTNEKYKFLENQGVNNVIYPIMNSNGNYVTSSKNELFYVMDYYNNQNALAPIKSVNLEKELLDLHLQTSYKKQLSPRDSRRKMEEIYEYLLYKFNVIEVFIRTVESSPFDEYSITILKNYHYILDAKSIMANLQKKLISNIKEKKSIEHSFIHNNPKLSHLIKYNGKNYLISLEHSKIGIPSLDIVKFYIETEDIEIDKKEIILDYFKNYSDDFYFDYFKFFTLLYYIKSLIVTGKDYVTSQSFLCTTSSIKNFMEMFELKKNE